jgi:predicted porin
MKPEVRTVLPPACAVAFVAAVFMPSVAQGQAQSTVSVYGVIDMNIERSNHRNINGAYGDLTQLKSDGLFGSRLGFTGAEDLGGGNKALFTLEAGMAPDTGAVGNATKFFSRLSFVGLENSGVGRITMGRQYTAQFDVLSRFFPLTRAPQYEPYAQIESIYTDNSVKFTRNVGALKLGAHYGLGESVQGNKGAANYSLGAAYEPGPWGVALSYDQSNTAYATTGNISNYGYVRKLVAAGRYSIGRATLYAGIRDGKTVNQSAVRTTRDNVAYVGIEYQFTPTINAAVGYYQNNVHYTSAAYTGTPRSVAARGTYSLSKRTDLYAVYGTARNAALNFNALSTLQPGKDSQTAFAIGVRHIF